MAVLISLVLLFSVGLGIGVIMRNRKAKPFPPVVELAQNALLPRLGHKIASLASQPAAKRSSTAPSSRGAEQGVPPAIPFLNDVPPASAGNPVPSASEVAKRSTFAAGPAGTVMPTSVLPVPHGYVAPISGSPSTQEPPPEAADTQGPTCEMGKSHYAAPLIQDARITLPDDDDLPVAFRSASPHSQAIVEAGDTADRVQITAPDGRIHLGGGTTVTFGASAD